MLGPRALPSGATGVPARSGRGVATIAAAAAVVASLGILAPRPLAAQGVEYTTVSHVKLAGSMGKFMSVAARFGGKGATQSTETVYLTPTKKRTDNGNHTEITDVDAGRIISIDHKKKQYYIMTFAELKKQMEAATKEAGAAADQSQSAPEPQQQAQDQGSQEVHAHFDVTPTGRHEKILGHSTAENYVTMGLDATQTQTDQQTGQQQTEKGNMTVFQDMWLAKDLHISKIEAEFAQNMAKKLDPSFDPAAFASIGQAMMKSLSNPQMSAAMKKAATEAKKLDGTPLRTVTYLVTVPDGKKFDPKLALGTAEAAKPKKKHHGFGGFLKSAVKKAEQQVGQQDQSGNDQQNGQDQGPKKQTTILTTTTNYTSVKLGSIPASVFAPPAGYKQVQPPGSGQS